MRYLLLALLPVGLILTAWTAVAQVESGQRGVVLRFGRVVDTVGPGLYIGWPWGIDRVQRVKIDHVRVVRIGFTESDADEFGIAVPAGQLLTGDHNLVNVRVDVNFTVNENEVEQFVLYENQVDDLVARAAETALAEWVAGRGVDDVLLHGKQVLPMWLKAETQRRIAPYGLGVRIDLVSVADVSAPRQVKDAFDAVNRAENEMLTEKNAARQFADRRQREGENYKNDLEKRAPVYAAGVKKIAQAEADAYVKRLAMLKTIRAENPNYLATVWWDEMTRVYAAMRAAGRLDLLDNRLGQGGLDIIQSPLPPAKK
ncbi:MAG TPA: SPFH domain-containing protein [Gemmataceae bacterium]|nr:SPFH domain-containing protein [Gemmataceae bacterium]